MWHICWFRFITESPRSTNVCCYYAFHFWPVGILLHTVGSLSNKNRNFKYSCLLALFHVFVLAPVANLSHGGGEYFKVAIHKEMIKRFVPSDNKIAEGQVFDWIVWLWQDLHLFIIITALCIILALITKRWRKNSFVFALTVLVLITMIGFTFARGSIYIRYLAVLTPILLCISITNYQRSDPTNGNLLFFLSPCFLCF